MKTLIRRIAAFALLSGLLISAQPQTVFAEGLLGGGSGSSSSASSGAVIDTSTSSLGYVTVCYDDTTGASMRVGVSFNGGSWSYYSYSMGSTKQYELSGGSGSYTVALYKKVGSSYATVSQVTFTAVVGQTPTGSALGGSTADQAAAAVSSKYAAYLTSVGEISFSSGDSVAKKAASLCKGKTTDQQKILAIYNYIAKNFKYDYDFANKVRSGQIRTYTPVPTSILSNKKGVCYDFSSLFAAMCRTQGIPCKLVKGYSTKINGYHAWNSVYDSKTDKWYTIDLTIAVCKKNRTASKFSGCCMSDKYYTPKSSV